MGRKRKHLTPEDPAQARKEDRQRYYERSVAIAGYPQ